MSLAVLDWRRRVARLYEDVRATPDPVEAHALWRAERDELLAHHAASPIPIGERAQFSGARYARYDAALRFELEVDLDGEPSSFSVETGTDGVVSFSRVGTIRLPEIGSLDVWWHEGYGGGIFVPFADTSPQTYGGGRYLLDTIKGADLGGEIDLLTGRGNLVVDLNFAYNPSCAYDPMWACPLAPQSNRLARPIDAGELYAPR